MLAETKGFAAFGPFPVHQLGATRRIPQGGHPSRPSLITTASVTTNGKVSASDFASPNGPTKNYVQFHVMQNIVPAGEQCPSGARAPILLFMNLTP